MNMNKENMENWLDCLSKKQLVYSVIFTCQLLQSYDAGLSWDEIQESLDEYNFKLEA